MILDKNLVFTNKVSVAAAAGSALVGDVINLDAANRKIGHGCSLKLCILVTTAFTSGGSATVQFRLMSGAAAAINPASDMDHIMTRAFPIASLTLGARFVVELPASLTNFGQYLGLVVTTAVATTTAGSISAFLAEDVEAWYPTADAANG